MCALKKGNFVTIVSETASENFGLPYWLGRVLKIAKECAELSTDEDEPLIRGATSQKQAGVQVELFGQASSAKQAGKMKHGARVYTQVLTTSRRSTLFWVPLTHILHKFDKMTSKNTIPQMVADWTVFSAEVLSKCTMGPTPVGVKEMNDELGFKMVVHDK